MNSHLQHPRNLLDWNDFLLQLRGCEEIPAITKNRHSGASRNDGTLAGILEIFTASEVFRITWTQAFAGMQINQRFSRALPQAAWSLWLPSPPLSTSRRKVWAPLTGMLSSRVAGGVGKRPCSTTRPSTRTA
jgi:hypothetical protein